MTAVLDTVNRLSGSLDADATKLARLDRYYAGTPRLGGVTEKFRQAFAGQVATMGSNWLRLVVGGAVDERLNVAAASPASR